MYASEEQQRKQKTSSIAGGFSATSAEITVKRWNVMSRFENGGRRRVMK